jgi:hypothetical protein
MICDQLTRLSEDTSMVAAVDTYAPSNKCLDVAGSANVQRAIGEGRTLYAVFTVTNTYGGASGGLILAVRGATATSGGSGSEVLASPVDLSRLYISSISLVTTGKRFVIPLPPITSLISVSGTLTHRFIDCATLAYGSASTGGRMTIDIVTDIQGANVAYPSGIKFS